jgi:hypothetical protein
MCVRNLGIATAIGIAALLVGGVLVAVAAVALVAPVVLAFLPAESPAKLYGGLTRTTPPAA